MRLTTRPHQQHGLGLVELMVGITVGLIVVAGASMVAVNQINEHRRLMLETQVQQDLRSAADLLQQDIRRAGFRGRAEYSSWAPATGVGTLLESPAQAATPNGYVDVALVNDSDGVVLTYFYARRTGTAPYAVRDVPEDNEHFGFRWDRAAKTIYLMLGAPSGSPNWQPVTDPESVRIEDLAVEISTQAVSLGEFCDKPCSPLYPSASAVCPTQEVREVRFSIRGQATHDAKVVRTLSGVERIRADELIGSCPP
jgi:type II secretory pathway pseudopilin PulG